MLEGWIHSSRAVEEVTEEEVLLVLRGKGKGFLLPR